MAKSTAVSEEVTPESLRRISIAVIEGTARSIRHQQQQLNLLYDRLLKSRVELVDALQHDLSLTEAEAVFEHSIVLHEIRICYNGINLVSENEKARKLERGEDNGNHAVPYGIVYIIPSPGMHTILSPLVAGIGAGNCVILEVGIIRSITHITYSDNLLATTNNKPFERSCTKSTE
jgi:acyl-CoA reductase-like NAD-dependent aldehyde dehydrogenase